MKENIASKDVFETIGDGIFIADLKGNLIEVNKSLIEMFGFRRNELLGKHIMDISNFDVPAFSDEYKTPLTLKLETEGYVKGYETQYTRKDGSVFFAELTVKSLLDSRGNIIHYLAVVRDISERKVWEQKVKEKETFLRKIIHADPNLIFVKDRY